MQAEDLIEAGRITGVTVGSIFAVVAVTVTLGAIANNLGYINNNISESVSIPPNDIR